MFQSVNNSSVGSVAIPCDVQGTSLLQVRPEQTSAAAVTASQVNIDSQNSSSSHTAAAESNGIILPSDLLVIVLGYLPVSEVVLVSQANPGYSQVCETQNLVARREMKCFHTKLTFEEAILGIGLSYAYHPDGKLKTVTARTSSFL